MLNGKKIVIGISGGIAAYKIPDLIRLFIKEGAQVKIAATLNAMQFVTRMTLETLSQNKVYLDVFEPVNDYSTNHISLSDWADALVVAPATANIIAKFANGIADDALSTTFAAFDKPVFIAPAMNTKMINHFALKNNVETLKQQGVKIINSQEGFLACGTQGDGRMEEPENIVKKLSLFFEQSHCFSGKKVMITAGPTYEAIDAVRFIGNHSSGKMGFALAEAMALQGADVTLITGPTYLMTSNPAIKRIDVVSAGDMYNACNNVFKNCDIAVMAAAVADYTVEKPAEHKLKKTDDTLSITLSPTPDILKSIGKTKTDKQFLVGFALETDNEIDNALKKLTAKNLDMIVLNSLKDEGVGFNSPTNKITIINNKGEKTAYPLKSKQAVAIDIINAIADNLKK